VVATGSFTNSLSWDSGLVPTNGISATVTNAGIAVFDGGTASVGVLGLGSGLGNGALDVQAGALTGQYVCVGAAWGGTGTVVQTGGCVVSTVSADPSFGIGYAAGSVGTYTLSDGLVLARGGTFHVGSWGNGTLVQTGGEVTGSAWMIVARYLGSVGNYTLSGGTLSQPMANYGLVVGEQGFGTLTVTNSGVADLVGGLAISGGLAGGTEGTGVVNLCSGGLIRTPGVTKNAGSHATFNFDGGTLRARGDGATLASFIWGLNQANVFEGGAVIDSGSNTVIVNQNLKSGCAKDGGLVKQGTGTLILTGTNTYNGSTVVSGGTLKAISPLLHRWSFNGNASDSVGHAPATVIGNVDTSSGRYYKLAGGAKGSSYISLGTNIIPEDKTPITIELWATQNAIQSWSRIINFGASVNNYMMMCWAMGTDGSTDLLEFFPLPANGGNGFQASNTMQPYALGTEYHIAMVITPGAGPGGTTLFQWYKMDASGAVLSSGSQSAAWTPDELLGQADMWLGHSEWGDNDASASYNEVRIWNVALTRAQLAENSVLGPDVLPALTVLPAQSGMVLASGTTLDLGGGSQTISGLCGSGAVSNGALNVTGAIAPGGTNTIGTLSLAPSASLSGTLLLDVARNGSCDRLLAQGALDLTKLTLQIQDLSQLKSGNVYVIAKCEPRSLTKPFKSTNLLGERWYVSYDNAGGEVRLVSLGLAIIVR